MVQQRKLENVLKNWKDCMVLNMGTINMIGLQIILSPPKHSPILQRKWISRCEYSCAVTPQIRQTGNRLSGNAGTAYASLLA